MVRIKRGEIFFVNLEPTKGSEQGGTRPALIVQNNIGNQYSSTTIIAPLTSKIYQKEYPMNVFVSKEDSGLEKDSIILLNQIRTIDKTRIGKRMGILDNATMDKVNGALKISLSL